MLFGAPWVRASFASCSNTLLKWVHMSHTRMSHITHVNESCHTYESVVSHVWMSDVNESFGTHVNQSCHTYEWVTSHIWMRHMSHVWMSHVTHMNEAGHTYGWIMSHIWMNHVSHMNESCHTFEWVMLRIRMSHISQNSPARTQCLTDQVVWAEVCALGHCNRLQQTATDCNRLQQIRFHPPKHNVWQIKICEQRYVLQNTATDCNRLQQTAKDCNTLQHTATHCNTLQQIRSHPPEDIIWQIKICEQGHVFQHRRHGHRASVADPVRFQH